MSVSGSKDFDLDVADWLRSEDSKAFAKSHAC